MSDMAEDGTEDEGCIGGGERDRIDNGRGVNPRGVIDLGVRAPIPRSCVGASGFRKSFDKSLSSSSTRFRASLSSWVSPPRI